MTHADGWKDEELDVDDYKDNNIHISRPPTKLDYPEVKSPPTSAQPCGCDLGAGWVCVWHQKMGDK